MYKNIKVSGRTQRLFQYDDCNRIHYYSRKRLSVVKLKRDLFNILSTLETILLNYMYKKIFLKLKSKVIRYFGVCLRRREKAYLI